MLFRIDKAFKEDQDTNNILELFETLNKNVISRLDLKMQIYTTEHNSNHNILPRVLDY